MIVVFELNEKNCLGEYYDNITDEGCGCCSEDFDKIKDKEKILAECKENILIVKKVCEYYNISFTEFIKREVKK